METGPAMETRLRRAAALLKEQAAVRAGAAASKQEVVAKALERLRTRTTAQRALEARLRSVLAELDAQERAAAKASQRAVHAERSVAKMRDEVAQVSVALLHRIIE